MRENVFYNSVSTHCLVYTADELKVKFACCA